MSSRRVGVAGLDDGELNVNIRFRDGVLGLVTAVEVDDDELPAAVKEEEEEELLPLFRTGEEGRVSSGVTSA